MNLRRFIWSVPFFSDAKRIEWFPPFWMMRLKVLELDEEWRTVRIRLPNNWISRNAGGSIFGGFQASLADPIAAMACVRIFPGYSVWTRGLTLDFQSEGNTDLELRFEFPRQLEKSIREELEHKNRATPSFDYGFYREDGSLCTAVSASVAIRPKGYSKRLLDR